MTARKTSKANTAAQLATQSLALQPNNITKGFDVTKIDTIDPDILEQLLAANDLTVLTSAQRVKLIRMMCESLGLNPLTRPLQFVEFKSGDGDNAASKTKLSIYATKECTEQLRKLHCVSVEDLKREILDGVCIVTAYVKDKEGRTDAAIGAVAMEVPGKAAYMWNNVLQAEKPGRAFNATEKANAMMKCETKAKRRATLSICGLGFLDETQIEDLVEPKIIQVTEEEIIASEQSEQAASNKAPEDTDFASSMELSQEVKEAISKAETKEELSAIHDKHFATFSEDLQIIFKGELTRRKMEINRDTVKSDMSAAVADQTKPAASGGGLFRKKAEQPQN